MSSTSLYKRTEIVGRGKFGVVYKGYNKQTKQVVAIKVLNLDTQDDEVSEVQQEIQYLTELRNVPNVTHYYGSFLNDTKLWIIMDYCAGGSLRTLLKAGVLEEKYVGVILRELLYALISVHKLGVIHRDIKAANVLITKEGNVQLCDFGVAAKITSNALKRTTMAGTPYWMAPEVIREGEAYNSKADIWSLGITMYEIATGNPPYCDKDAMWAMQLISKSTPPRLEGREYSAVLKECIALCLDENPEERLSAEDLMKCKLVRLYKNHPKAILKEVVSRYLVWRDRNSSRDSVFVNLEDNIATATDENKDEQGSPPQSGANPNQIQVKWDFDSLSSKEYIIENDIDFENVNDSYQYNEDSAQDTYQTMPTLQANTFTNTNTNTGYNSNGESSANPTLKPFPSRPAQSEIPKSLQMLFEEEDPQESINPPGAYDLSTTSYDERNDSPTIEIPDMDNLANFGPGTSNFTNSGTSTLNSSSTLVQSSQLHPALNKPPTLYHSQSASGKLESRFGTNPTRPHKKTISNSFNASSEHQNQIPASTTPHTPPYSVSTNFKTPSPKPPPSTLMSSLNTATGSPSKSMKALHNNANPLLQPINFKLEQNQHNQNQPVQSQSQTQNQSASTQPIQTNSKRGRGFHIQMPTPSNTFNTLSALTNEQFDNNENVNQFGINPAQVTNAPLTMTPVTEKEVAFPQANTANDSDEDTTTRDRTESTSSQRSQPATHPKKSISSASNPVSTTPVSSNLNLNTRQGSVASSQATTKFPVIPQLNGEFFIDSTPKQKLVNELDMMIKLFSQGLDALEENL